MVTILVASLALSLSQVADARIRVSAAVRAPSPLVGDPIDLSVTVTWMRDITLFNPAWPDQVGSFELLRVDKESPIETGQWIEQRWTLRLITFAPGRLTIPSLPIRYQRPGDGSSGMVATEPLTLDVGETAVQLGGGIRPVKPPLKQAWEFVDVAWGALTAVLILAPAVMMARRRRPVPKLRVIVKPAPARPFDATAALWELENALPSAEHDAPLFYTAVCDVVRQFLERTHGVPATRLSSSETLQAVAGRPGLESVGAVLSKLFSSIDKVKFAAHHPPSAEHPVLIQRARDVVSGVRRL